VWRNPPWLNRQRTEKKERPLGREIGLLVLDKLLLAVLAATVGLLLQHYFEQSERRQERARQIADIAVSQPLTLASRVPENVDALRLYLNELHVGAAHLDNKKLTELELKITSDVLLAMEWYRTDRALVHTGNDILRYVDVLVTGATARTLNDTDIVGAQLLLQKAHRFHARAVELSRQRALGNVDRAYERPVTP
jgi:hypothetical protein